MIANARMYSVTPEAAAQWRALFVAIAERAQMSLDVISHPAPLPLEDLWARADLGAVFMCGLPFAKAAPQPHLLAVPVPAPPEFSSAPMYWSNFVVRADSQFQCVSDTFGHRLALTVPGSQSGFASALEYFCSIPGPQPRFAQLIAPTISPGVALRAVVDDMADIAPVDAYAFALLERFDRDLTARVRVIAKTAEAPIPALVSSELPAPRLQAALIEAHLDPTIQQLMDAVLIQRFDVIAPASYASLRARHAQALSYWRRHALAAKIHPAFGLLSN